MSITDTRARRKVSTYARDLLELLDRMATEEAAALAKPPVVVGSVSCGPLYYPSPKLTGQVRRTSMDLTRALAELRKP